MARHYNEYGFVNDVTPGNGRCFTKDELDMMIAGDPIGFPLTEGRVMVFSKSGCFITCDGEKVRMAMNDKALDALYDLWPMKFLTYKKPMVYGCAILCKESEVDDIPMMDITMLEKRPYETPMVFHNYPFSLSPLEEMNMRLRYGK